MNLDLTGRLTSARSPILLCCRLKKNIGIVSAQVQPGSPNPPLEYHGFPRSKAISSLRASPSLQRKH
ncbi:hypothetical protein FVEG_11416 [Fusarium verticillioides 7600]|uniref:Uncharacterized protein n=1 Tax=Gibberella moniliformis (strain M3125 / FGSC 7600) TaxID=334819 RepID=W7N8I0_GIBM7|nr:hypothetical protein FVEG_11416 [Fusarium verticillioides 7600]EWG52792.1 hypothetical protein FVEG_11416 [Fusarium verticillioides 7600]